MQKMIQLRHVSEDLHRELKVRAAREGMTLSDYLVREVARIAQRPALHELRERLAQRSRVAPRVSTAKAVRTERNER
jgi:antitoxin FitA